MLLWIAAGLSLFSFLFHAIKGQQGYVKAIMQTDALPPLRKSLSLIGWHCGSVLFLGSALASFYMGLNGIAIELLWFIVFINAAVALVFMMLILQGHNMLIRMPGMYLSAVIAALNAGAIIPLF